MASTSSSPQPALQPGSPLCDGGAQADSALAVDVVYIHGLRGGPFGTWRTAPTAAAEDKQRDAVLVWPSDWLAADVGPRVRLLSLAFRSRYSDWGSATSPRLEALAEELLQTLVAAGVGQRPLVVVTHSMGGVLLKLLLARSMEAAAADAAPPCARGALAAQLRGAVFYSCPHFGSRLAELGAWRLARLAAPVAELRSSNVDQLAALNEPLRAAHRRKRHPLRVVCFLEGRPTPLLQLPVPPGLAARAPAIRYEVVAPESAYPGFGDLVVLPQADHVTACKPGAKGDPSYALVLQLVRDVLAEAEQVPGTT